MCQTTFITDIITETEKTWCKQPPRKRNRYPRVSPRSLACMLPCSPCATQKNRFRVVFRGIGQDGGMQRPAAPWTVSKVPLCLKGTNKSVTFPIKAFVI